MNPLGEAVLGEVEAERRLETVLATIRRPDVDYVSVKITAIYSQVDPLAFDHTVDVLSDRLRRLFRAGREAGTFVNLDMEAYDDLHLTVAAFRRVLDEAEFADLDAGIVLQAYIPDSVAVLEDLVAWGRPIKVRIVKGANLAMERVEAELRGWPQAPYTTKAEVDANYKRLLDLALAGGVRIGAASHNLFDVAWALVAAEEAGAQDRLEIEMLEGMAPAQAEAVRRRVGQLLLYAPVVAHDDFQAAIAYLVRRLDENTAAENFLHHLFTLTPGSPDWDDQRARFEKSVVDRHHVERAPRRDQDRATEERSFDPEGPFANEPDTDFTSAANRRWVADHIAAWRPPAGLEEADLDGVERAVATVRTAAVAWAALPEAERRRVLHRVAEVLAARRGEAIAAMVHDGNKTIAEADPEVSEAIDFATLVRPQRAPRRRAPGRRPALRPLPRDGRGLAVELPAGHRRRRGAGRPGRRLRRDPQAGPPDRRRRTLPGRLLSRGRRAREAPLLPADARGRGGPPTAHPPRRRRRGPHRGVGHGPAVPLVGPDPAPARRDQRQERHGRSPPPPTSTPPSPTSSTRRSATPARSAPPPAWPSSRPRVYDGPHFLRRLADAVRSLRVGPATDPASRVGPADRPARGASGPGAHPAGRRRGVAGAARRRTAPRSAPASARGRGSTRPSASARSWASSGWPTSTRRSRSRTPSPSA